MSFMKGLAEAELGGMYGSIRSLLRLGIASVYCWNVFNGRESASCRSNPQWGGAIRYSASHSFPPSEAKSRDYCKSTVCAYILLKLPQFGTSVFDYGNCQWERI